MASSLREVSRELRALREQERKYCKRRERSTTLTGWTLRTAMCIASMCAWDFSLAAEWLATRRRRGARPDTEEEQNFDMLQVLEDMFLRLDLEELTNWADPTAERILQGSVTAAATKWILERRTKDWVSERNRRHGQAVRSELVVDQYNAFATSVSDVVEIPLVGSCATWAGRNWMRRWRERHRGVVGQIRPQEQISLEELRNIFSSASKEMPWRTSPSPILLGLNPTKNSQKS